MSEIERQNYGSVRVAAKLVNGKLLIWSETRGERFQGISLNVDGKLKRALLALVKEVIES